MAEEILERGVPADEACRMSATAFACEDCQDPWVGCPDCGRCHVHDRCAPGE